MQPSGRTAFAGCIALNKAGASITASTRTFFLEYSNKEKVMWNKIRCRKKEKNKRLQSRKKWFPSISVGQLFYDSESILQQQKCEQQSHLCPIHATTHSHTHSKKSCFTHRLTLSRTFSTIIISKSQQVP
jgi:hypothetical protein